MVLRRLQLVDIRDHVVWANALQTFVRRNESIGHKDFFNHNCFKGFGFRNLREQFFICCPEKPYVHLWEHVILTDE